MSKKKKLFQYILNKPKDLRFEELEKVIILCGYHLDHFNRQSCNLYQKERSYFDHPEENAGKKLFAEPAY